jgi:Family of unknown function (DUF6893)
MKKLLFLGLVAGVVAVALQNSQDIRRYLNMRKM